MFETFLLKKELSEIRETEVTQKTRHLFYQNTGKFLWQDDPKLKKANADIHEMFKTITNQKQLLSFANPINIKNNSGARIKITIWNMFFYAKAVKNSRKILQLYNSMTTNPKMIKKFDEYIWYPGVLEGLIHLYY